MPSCEVSSLPSASARCCSFCKANTDRDGRAQPKRMAVVQQSHQKKKQPWRCSRCQSQWYCSKDCQKMDWKRHKKECKRIAAQKAWNELQEIVQSTSPEQATESFHRTNDEIAATIKKQQNPGKEQESLACENVVDTVNSLGTNESNEFLTDIWTKSNRPAIDAKEKSRPMNSPSTTRNATSSLRPKQETARTSPHPKQHDEDDIFQFYIEELPHLKCFQIEVRLKSAAHDENAIKLEHWSVNVAHENEELSIVSLHNAYHSRDLVFRLPGQVNRSIDFVEISKGATLSLRLSFAGDSDMITLYGSNLMSTEMANRLSCSGCNSVLVMNDECSIDGISNESDDDVSCSIERVVALPSGWWDDMSDYLICYEGQASVDFSSSATAARTGLVLEDDTMLVYHTKDVSHSVQVLALPGYGDGEEQESNTVTSTVAVPLVRGGRPWTDSVGGATVTCSSCCLVLGVAPLELVDTVRFFKHRVVVEEKTLLSTLAFCAHSMVRYAESKAVFSFVIRCEGQSTATLVLHLLGWDRKAACSFNQSGAQGDLAWSRLVKVLYEERNDITVPTNEESTSTNNDWMWTQGDWCCPTPGRTGVSLETVKEEKKMESISDLRVSYVSLVLETNEWSSLKKELGEASRLYSDELMKATFLAKAGRLPAESAFCGLAGIFLDSC